MSSSLPEQMAGQSGGAMSALGAGQQPAAALKATFERRASEPLLRLAQRLDHERIGREWTYAKWLCHAVRAEAWLAEQGLQRGDRLAVSLPNSPELALVYFAALLRGLVVIPIDPLKGANEKLEILSEGRCTTLLCDSAEWATGELRLLDFEAWASLLTTPPAVSFDAALTQLEGIDAEALYLIAFTSGSTGKPKGVQHSFGNLFRTARSFAQATGLHEQHRVLHNLPMCYMAGILNLIWLPVSAGAQIVLADRFQVSTLPYFWDTVADHQADYFYLIPTLAALLLRLDRGQRGEAYCRSRRLTTCIGTAPLSAAVRQQFEQRYHVQLLECYGLSETLFVSVQRPDHAPAPGSPHLGVGHALEGTRLSFAPDGEVLIDTDWNFTGYFNLSEAAAVPFPSGDLGERAPDGTLHITGRKKDLIIRGGVNITPRRLEEQLAHAPFFADLQWGEYCVLGLPEPTLGEKTVLFYTGATLTPELRQRLMQFVLQQLGRDYSIDQLTHLPELPKNINGKIDKLALTRQFG